MKYKDVLRNSLYLDEELQDYFNEMSKKGWRLDFVGYYYRFIKRLREEKNMTQQQLADKLSVSAKTISKWETAK